MTAFCSLQSGRENTGRYTAQPSQIGWRLNTTKGDSHFCLPTGRQSGGISRSETPQWRPIMLPLTFLVGRLSLGTPTRLIATNLFFSSVLPKSVRWPNVKIVCTAGTIRSLCYLRSTSKHVEYRQNEPSPLQHLCFVGWDRGPRVLPNCAESDSLCRGRVTVRTRFGRTLPIAREISLGMASPADHDLAVQAKRTRVARAVLCAA